jgi:hypothetical protein
MFNFLTRVSCWVRSRLLSSEGIFDFVQIKKKNKKAAEACLARVSCSAAFQWCVRQTLMVVIVILPYHLIYIGVLFLFRWRMYRDSA